VSARTDYLGPALRIVGVPLGIAALMLRPVGTPAAVGIVALVGVIGLLTPTSKSADVVPVRWLAVTGLGLAAFVVARVLVQAVPAPSHTWAIAGATVAAVSEEAFFRRLVYGWLASSYSGLLAVLVSAACFALVHVPAYGFISLPLNLAAGLLFGWQRWASGTWTASAVTHVAANFLQMGGVFIL
jgi:membrane protease YdiL (CAAX protease family)